MVLEKEIDAPAPATTAAPLPYLGRSARIVGDWQSVDATSTPHEKNKRGELGKPLLNWWYNRTAHDPIGRITFSDSAADRRNAMQTARFSKLLDDKYWGRLGRTRVRWMSFDSGHLTTPGGVVQPVEKDRGYYYPLKENTRRFDILKEKLKSKA